MKRRWLLVLLVLCLFQLTGCGFKDIDNRFFVVTMGVDKPKEGGKKYEVFLKLAIPADKPQVGKKDFQLISEQSDTIAGAIRLLKSKVDKEFDFGHTKLLLVGPSLAEEYMSDVIDWMQRRREIQIISWIAIGTPSVKKVLELSPPTERFPSNALFLAFSGDGVESSYISKQFLFTLYRDMAEPGIDPILPIVKTTGDTHQIQKVAIFDQKLRMKLILPSEDTRLLNLLKNSEDTFYSVVNVTGSNETFTLYSNSIKSDIKLRKKSDGKLAIHVSIPYTATVEEYHPHQNIPSGKIAMLEKETDRALELQVEKLIKKLQKNKVDPLGIGLNYRSMWRSAKVDEEQWLDMYRAMDIQVDVKTKIRSTGIFE